MDPVSVIGTYLASQGIPFERVGDQACAFQLHGERKHGIPVVMTVGERTISLQSFFMRRPIDDAGAFYRLLLARNLRPSRVRFAADAEGDVYLAADLPLDGFDETTLDGILGELLYACDQMFDAAIAVGFASYLERDRAWRAAQPGKENSPKPSD